MQRLHLECEICRFEFGNPKSVLLRLAHGRRAAQHLLSAGWQLIGMSQQQTHLPKLLLAQRWTERGHAGEPDAIFHLPVVLSRGVIGHTVPLKQLRRFRAYIIWYILHGY